MIKAFGIARLPELVFGAGSINQLADKISNYGQSILLVTGQSAFINSSHWPKIEAQLNERNISWEHYKVGGEPSPSLVDEAVVQFKDKKIEVVVAIGGGSVLDAAKAIAGLLRHGDSVMDYLEGVGKGKNYHGDSLPFIACPTTAGSGSEATKNAVLSERHDNGFKKSFRHENLTAQVAIVDSDLLDSCPDKLLAGNALDAFTQLLEAYVSTRANPFTDSLILPAIEEFSKAIMPAYKERDPQALTVLAYASMISGIVLAQTGLGVVHGLASPLGAYTNAPHGIVCGIMLAKGMECNINAMLEREPENPALERYAHVSRIINGLSFHSKTEDRLAALIGTLENWEKALNIPRLSDYGIEDSQLDKIVANCRGSSMLTNPIELSDAEIKALLLAKL